jgi:host factor-I protein
VDQLSNGLQVQFLQNLQESEMPIAVYLVNGIRLQGKIEFFDNYIVAVRHTMTQLVYKHAISTIVPGTGDGPEGARAEQSEGKPRVTIRAKRTWSAGSERK